MTSHFLELLLLGSLSTACVLRFLPGPRFKHLFVAAAALTVLFCIVDLALGNLRWQILPAYALALLLLISSLRRRDPPPAPRKPSLLARVAALFGVLLTFVWFGIAVSIPWLFPMFAVPAPAGSFAVGISDIHLVDETRPEANTEDPDDHRELMIRVWYPAGSIDGIKPEPLVREIEPLHEIFSRGVPIPSFVFSHLREISSHSYLDAPLASEGKPFPVLLYSHGNSFYASQNTLLMEHLASYGYVVVAIEHPYHASWVRFPDGRIAKYQEQLPGVADWTAEQLDLLRAQNARLEESHFADDYETHYETTATYLDSQQHGNQRAELWVDDTEFVLDQLERADTDETSPFARFSGTLDLDRIGVFGMSLGGATAGLMCARDPRVKAGINMDGAQFGNDAPSIELERPFFLFNSDRRKNPTDPPVPFELNEFIVRQSKNQTYSLAVAGATHGSFSDFAIMSRPSAWMIATIEPWSMKVLMDDYTLAFFNKHLKGTTEPLLDGEPQKHRGVLTFERSK